MVTPNKKLQPFVAVGLLLIAAASVAQGASVSAGAAASASTATFPITNNWTLMSSESGISYCPITVPNTVLGALLELNAARVAGGDPAIFEFPDGGVDPFYGKNLASMPTANFTAPWVFSTSFATPTSTTGTGPYHVLQLNGINYAANVTLNGVVVATASSIIGGIRRFMLDVDQVLFTNGSANALVLSIAPPLHSWTTDFSFSFLDWAPFPADNSMGIWRDVSLLSLPRFQTTTKPPQDIAFFAEGVSVATLLPPTVGAATPTAYVTIQATVRCFPLAACVAVTTADVGFSLVALTTYPGVASIAFPTSNQSTFVASEDGESGEARFTWSWENDESLILQDPLLWWPWQLGNQPLFRIVLQLDGYNISAPSGHQFGIRQMTQAESSGGACQLLVNNVPIQIRGGGWAPDLFYRIVANTAGGNESRIQHQLEMIRHMNLNTIRLEGKFEYAEFFELASEMGLLVIPGMECCTSWQNWGQWTINMTKIAKLSVRDQIRRLGHYACNVAFLASSDELPPVAIEAMYRAVFADEGWPNPVIAAASEQESPISGSTGVKMTGPYSWVPPVYWLNNTDGQTLNLGGAWGFLTEGGPGEAPMTFNSWTRTVPAANVWNASEGGSLSSWWDAHMGNPLGKFASLYRYTPPLDARFGPSANAASYCYKAQLQNYEGIRAMFEGYSRMKTANATGVVQWMMNDAFPNHLWHLYDYYLVAGGGYYGAKAAGEPLHLMLSYVDGTVSLINNRFDDRLGPFLLTASAYVVSPTCKQFFATETIVVPFVASDASLDVFSLNFTDLNRKALSISPQPAGVGSTYFVQLVLSNSSVAQLATSWYLLSTKMDVVNFSDSNNLWSNCSQWADFTALKASPVAALAFASVVFDAVAGYPSRVQITAVLVNESPDALAMFAHVTVVCQDSGLELSPVFWNDNFITLVPQSNVTVVGDVYRGACVNIELKVQSYRDVL